MKYIQRRDNQLNTLETVDQCETKAEAWHLMREYHTSDPSAHYYISNRACKEWYNR